MPIVLELLSGQAQVLLAAAKRERQVALDRLSEARLRMHPAECTCSCAQRIDAEIDEREALALSKHLTVLIGEIERAMGPQR